MPTEYSRQGSPPAAIRDRRSKKEQTDVDSSSGRNVAKYLVPGVSIYDYYKRLGRSRDW